MDNVPHRLGPWRGTGITEQTIMKGWYPDPDGTPGRYRFFDGATWSAATTDDPRTPPPLTADERHNRRAVRGLAVIAAVTVVGLLIIWGATRTITGSLSPLGEGATRPAAEDAATPGRSLPPGDPCRGGSPTTRAQHPADDRVHGGNLSFPAAPGFAQATPEGRLTFAWDTSQQTFTVDQDPAWVAQLAVGQVRAADGFGPGAQGAAERVLRCVLASDLYRPYDASAALTGSAPRTVSGSDGWRVAAQVLVGADGLAVPGDRVTVVVVPDGENWGLFLSAVPIGNESLAAAARAAADGLAAS